MSATSATIMATAAAFCNDPGQRVYTNVKLLVPLQQAVRDLQQELIDNDASFTKKKLSLPIEVAVSATVVTLPIDFWAPIDLYDRPNGGDASAWRKVQPVEFIRDESQHSEILEWAYNEGQMLVNPPTSARECRLFYYAGLPIPVGPLTVIQEDEYISYLGLRTAAIAAVIIGENYNRGQALNQEAQFALRKLISLVVKENQRFVATRKPYRSITRERRNVVRRFWP